jgi:hypothetical protein
MGKIDAPSTTLPKRSPARHHQHVLEGTACRRNGPIPAQAHRGVRARYPAAALYEFWLEHKPAEESVLAGFRASYPVVEKLAQYGTLLLLDLADQTRFPPTSGARDEELLELNLSSVVRFAVPYCRPEVLDWGLARGLNDRDSPMPRSKTKSNFARDSALVNAWRLVIEDFRDGSSSLLEVLKRHYRPTDKRLLQDFFLRCRVENK